MSKAPCVSIVDDEPSARDTLEMLLSREGYDLAFASNGPEALKKAAELTPDPILLDVMMPGLEGLSLPVPARQPAPGRGARDYGHSVR